LHLKFFPDVISTILKTKQGQANITSATQSFSVLKIPKVNGLLRPLPDSKLRRRLMRLYNHQLATGHGRLTIKNQF